MFAKDISAIVTEVAEAEGFEPAALMAVTQVEGGPVDLLDGRQDGRVYGLLMIRWEGHYFWRLLPEALRLKAQRAGLADPRAGAVKNPRSQERRHTLLNRARQIDEAAALQSVSIGIGQVMGANFARCGYVSVLDMWQDCQTVEGQVRCMARFIKAAKLDRHLRAHDWAAFARGYNGPGYARNRYDEKLQAAYLRFGGLKTEVPKYRPFVLSMGNPHASSVRELQQRLRDLGYPVTVDGDFGPMTQRQVMAFQAENGLTADGKVGFKTQEALQTASYIIPDERQGTSTRELAKRSRITKKGLTARNTAVTTATLTAGAKAADETGVFEKMTDKAEEVGGTVSALQPIIDFATANWWVLPVGALVVIAVWTQGVVAARVEDHRTGKTL